MTVAALWTEIWADLGSPVFQIQLLSLTVCLGLSWLVSHWIKPYLSVKASIQDGWEVSRQGFSRILFPFISLLITALSLTVLNHWQHTGLLKLAATLLGAMVIIRLIIYLLRYVFRTSLWVELAERWLVALVWLIVALHLSGLLPEITDLLDQLSIDLGKHRISVLLILQALITVLITLFITLWLGRVLESQLMQANQIDINVRVVLSKLGRTSLILIGVLGALSAIGFDISLLSVFGGALGVGLGFGLQKIASNYISGFIILLDQSLHLGDVLTVDGHQGTVQQLRARYLVLRKLNGTDVVIPNDTLITSTVINHSYSDRNAQVLVTLQVSYESPLECAMALTTEAAREQTRVLRKPEPNVLVHGFGENGIDLHLSFWVEDPEEGCAELKSCILIKIREKFMEQGIVIPYPQREVRVLQTSTV